MTCKVTFKGGPRDGQVKDYPHDPLFIGCVTEAHEKGMHGLYRTGGSWRDRMVPTAATAVWEDLPWPGGKQ